MVSIQEFFTLHNQSDVITVVFGATTGLLTLVGLISIFVAINSQHKVEKARELYWDLAALPYQYSGYKDDKIGKKIYHIFLLYESIIKPAGDFTAKVVVVVKLSIIFVSLAWASILLFLRTTLYLVEYVFIVIVVFGIVILFLAFYSIVDKLLHINRLANLPTTEQLLDADNSHYDAQAISLAGIAMRLKISRKVDGYQVSVGFPVQFVEFFIKPIITGSRIGQKKDDLPEIVKWDDDMYRVTKGHYRWWLTSPLHWFDVCEFKMLDCMENISIQMELNCSKGIVHVSYYNIPVIDLKELGTIESITKLPDNYSEIYIQNRDDNRL